MNSFGDDQEDERNAFHPLLFIVLAVLQNFIHYHEKSSPQ